MSSDNATFGELRTVLRRQYVDDSAGNEWTRKINKDGSVTEWELNQKTETTTTDEIAHIYLYLIQENQAEGEPLHWSLFVAGETGVGSLYQVTGDATFMTYNHESNVDIRVSPTYRTGYQICELNEIDQILVRQYLGSEPPPQAENRAAVTENCQGWAIRVLRRLQGANMVDEEIVDRMEAMMEDV